MIQIPLNKGPRLSCPWTHVGGQVQTVQHLPAQAQIPVAKWKPFSSTCVSRAGNLSCLLISATPGGGAGLSHTFRGSCTHSARGARFSIFYYCESIISGLCFLATEGILAIVTVILTASICLSGTLFLFCFF